MKRPRRAGRSGFVSVKVSALVIVRVVVLALAAVLAAGWATYVEIRKRSTQAPPVKERTMDVTLVPLENAGAPLTAEPSTAGSTH